MANELKHGSVGTELTQAEWEAVGTHVFSSQAAGDIMYASSTSQLTRLGKGADNTVLHLASGIPAWSATLAGLTLTTPTISSTGFANANHAHAASNSGGALTYLGTIATGVWQGTDVGVAYGGTGVSTLTDNAVLTGTGASAITAEGNLSFDGSTLFINDTVNAKMTTGLSINQGAADDHILSFKSSDPSGGHGLVSAHLLKATEIDDYGVFSKASDAYGGLGILAIADDAALTTVLQMGVFGGTPSTDKSTGCAALFEITCYEHDGADGLANITADGNLFAVRARVGNSPTTRFMVDEDGQLYATANGHTGDVSVGLLSDRYDDARLVRALGHAQTSAGVKGMIKDKWDDFVEYNEQDLIEAGVLGDTMANNGMLNVTGLQRLHNGAIWQGYVRQLEIQERIDTLEEKLLAIEGAK